MNDAVLADYCSASLIQQYFIDLERIYHDLVITDIRINRSMDATPLLSFFTIEATLC